MVLTSIARSAALLTLATLGLIPGPTAAAVGSDRADDPPPGLAAAALLDHDRLDRIPVGATFVLSGVLLGDGVAADLDLERFEVFADGAVIVEGGARGDRPRPRPEVVLLRGVVRGDPGSRVFVGVGRSGTHGYVKRDDDVHLISTGPFVPDPAARVLHVTRAADLPAAAGDGPFCGTTPDQPGLAIGVDPAPAPADPLPEGGGEICRVAQIAIDSDYEFSQIFSGNTDAAAEYATILAGGSSEIYEANVSVRFEVSYLRTFAQDNDPYAAGGLSSALVEFRDHWRQTQGEISRQTAHLVSGRSLGGGIAYVGAVCSLQWGYAVSANLNGTFPFPLQSHDDGNWDIIVFSHELGHNYGTFHTHDGYVPPIDECGNGDCSQAPAGTIMSYCHLCPGGLSNIALEFHPLVRDKISQYLLNIESTGCDLREICPEVFGACCFPDQCTDVAGTVCVAIGGAFAGVDTTCETAQCVTGACCLPAGGCSTVSSFGLCAEIGGTYSGNGTACEDVTCTTAYCTANSTFSGEHITNVFVGSISHSSGVSLYSDFTYISSSVVQGESYPIQVTLGSALASDIGGVWVDWNADLDFSDPGETITNGWSGAGPYQATITVPATATPGPTRMRVRIQDQFFDHLCVACGSTVTGEVEDYKLIVVEPAAGGEYCSASGLFFANEYVSHVLFAGISHPSSISLYSDFTGVSTALLPGTTYAFTATITSGLASDLGGLWVDWNQDKDFSDPGETITTSWSGDGPYTVPVTVPADAPAGATRIRVRLQDGAFDPAPLACGNTTFGEVEDFTVQVLGGAGPCPEDLDGNGLVDFPDLLEILLRWGPCEAACPEDLDGNGLVDFGDILLVLLRWGECE